MAYSTTMIRSFTNQEVLRHTTGNNFSVYSPFKKKWFAELDDKQLELLSIPDPKTEISIKSSDLAEYLADTEVSQAKYTGIW